ncbi:MarR family winged helix-turn-helix transcriptional regulator [Neorhizobium galegae]|uniref:MarR family winged helix-turn-helix transcriptional regulator n=1 Tax=Neorhizobium galegae TaxID=399 RepID=UPI001AE479D4|nr:MarR family transcriptional regulator [Neorhizobium galegae]
MAKECIDVEAQPLLRAILALGRRLRSERPNGAVTLAAISLLGTLNRLGPMPAVQLAAEERLQPQSLTRIVANLEHAGLIERRRDPMDQRALIIALTAKGKSELVEDLRARQKWLQDAMAEILSEQEHAMLSTAANIMLARSSRRSKTGMARRP